MKKSPSGALFLLVPSTSLPVFLGLLFIFSITGALTLSCASNPMEKALQGISEDRLRADVEYLSSDSCDGRLPFTAGADRAVKYLEKQFENIGLEAFGDSYLQQVPLVKITTEVPQTVPISLPGEVLSLENGSDLALFTQSLDAEVQVEDAELIFAGYGIVAPEYAKNDYARLENPENKIAVVFVNDPGLDSGSDYFRGDEMTYYGRWTYKFEEGGRQNLKGVLIIHEDRGAGYGWSVASASEVRFALDGKTGGRSAIDEKPESANAPGGKSGFEAVAENACPLRGWISRGAAEALLDKCGYDIDSLKAAARKSDFEPFSLNARLSVNLRSSFEKAESPNVLAYLPGSGETDECLVCTAHWDHLGHSSTPVNGDSVINGASDNATAMAWLLETARLFKSLPEAPKRNIVFLLPTCEEKGMYGSEYYVGHPVFPMEKTLAVVNMDVLPLWGENNDLTITGYGRSDLDSLIRPFAVAQGRYLTPDPQAYNGMFYRSDHLPFMRKGVPAMFAKGWNDNRLRGKEWSADAIERYWAETYHKPSDQTSSSDDYSGLRQEVELFARFLYSLANSEHKPRWRPDSEFQRK